MFLGRYGSDATGTERVDKFFYSHLFGHPFEQMIALSVIIGEGVLDRFPKLRFVFLESGCGWLPYWFERMDEHYEVLGVQLPALKTEPSKLLERGQLYFSCEAGREGTRARRRRHRRRLDRLRFRLQPLRQPLPRRLRTDRQSSDAQRRDEAQDFKRQRAPALSAGLGRAMMQQKV